ncbi:AAA family ATPase [Microbacterium ulmi]|uniref:AAA family ATPase n=1 Tax=Microbacterium ulmi TaxID=179095 RepID=A0A7Y2LYF3_9MICO|nr:AAA family ATPase [Microbacterium ulmi]NII68405.1 putative ATPase [Microbacterium ulmi]NNH03067.1 AAA family ATPase [Microbacterium ulmi]
MEIQRVRVSTFKSLYDVEARLDHLSVITGPNGSGKSNLVDALMFLGDTYRHGLEFAVSRAGGYENVAYRRTRRAKKAVSFEVDVSMSAADLSSSRNYYFMRRHDDKPFPAGLDLRLRHTFSFRASSQKLLADFEVVHESLQLFSADDEPVLDVQITRDGIVTQWGNVRSSGLRRPDVTVMFRPFLDKEFDWEKWGRKPGPTELSTDFLRFMNVASLMADHVEQIRVFQLSPHLSRSSGVATPNAELGRHGENLPGAAHNLRRRDSDSWSKIESAMRAVVPGLQSITTIPTEDRRLAVQFREAGVGRAWNASEVSDGTIQTFALLVALFDRRATLLIIEEPENALHPWILRQVLDLAKATDKQILFTTHSQVVLDYIDPEVVQLMWMRRGHSQLRQFIGIDPELADGLVSGRLSTFEVYDSGLFTEAVPRGFVEVGAEEEDE